MSNCNKYFTSSFFKRTEGSQVGGLAHELTHAADFERRLSFTSKWQRAIGRNVALLHQAAELNHEAHLPLFDDLAARYYYLPSVYAASNMTEALAESVSHYIYGSHNPSPAALTFINKYVLSEPPALPDSAISFESALRLIGKDHYAEAIAVLDQIIKSEPRYFAAYYYRTHAYLKMKQAKQALLDSDRCLAMLKSLDIPKLEVYSPNSYYERAQILTLLGRRKEALDSINTAFSLAPNNASIAAAHQRMLVGKAPRKLE